MKIVLQDGIKDCGICSLLSIVRFYGGDVSKEYLREITNTTKDGVSALGLIEGATKLGFEAVGVFGEINKINVNNLPCLGHILTNKSYKHFVAIYKIDFDKEKIHIMDPAVGQRILSFTEYKILSTNNYIFLKPLKKIPLIKPRKIIIKEIIKYLKNNKIQSGVFWGLTLLYFILNIIVSFHFKYLIEFSIQYNTTSNILIISFSIMFFYIFKYLIDFVRNILLDKIILMFDSIITMKVLKQIFYLPYLYYKNRTTGEVLSRIKDLLVVKNYLIEVISILIIAVGTSLPEIFTSIAAVKKGKHDIVVKYKCPVLKEGIADVIHYVQQLSHRTVRQRQLEIQHIVTQADQRRRGRRECTDDQAHPLPCGMEKRHAAGNQCLHNGYAGGQGCKSHHHKEHQSHHASCSAHGIKHLRQRHEHQAGAGGHALGAGEHVHRRNDHQTGKQRHTGIEQFDLADAAVQVHIFSHI